MYFGSFNNNFRMRFHFSPVSRRIFPDEWVAACQIPAVLLCILGGLAGCKQKTSPEISSGSSEIQGIFTLLGADKTGVDFVNQVEDGENFNILTYRNFYNGGGVAIGDVNNDGLPDLYFTANQLKNKLYLNKGDFVFEDITEKAGVGGAGAWSTGVTMADVNADGYLDIYVCNSGDVDGKFRENELFINNGLSAQTGEWSGSFTEKAKAFHLNNNGYSTHAAFFDYDLDGDLDVYILNNSFKDPSKIDLYKKAREIPDEGGDRLMRNDGGTFTDISLEAGIYTSIIGFGLGVAVGDLNNDQWPDIYVSNDFWERDYLYINQGNGKFSEELIDRINYCPVSSMGADIADLNNDGSPEIFTTDMLPADNYRLKTTIAFDPYHLEDLKYRANFHYQMVQNCLQWNDGNGHFQEIGLLAGVAATDWSWGALIFDFENDGKQDIFVSNGILKDIMSMDFRDFIGDSQNRNRIAAEKGTFNYKDFITLIPSKPLKNYAFRNSGNLEFRDRADVLGLSQPSFSNGSAYGDLDNDGDYDLVVNNINSPGFIYRNETDQKTGHHFLKVRFKGPDLNPFGIGAQVTLRVHGEIRVLQNFNTRGFESSIEPSLLFGLGNTPQIEELEVIWPDKKTQVIADVQPDETLVLDYTHANGLKNNPDNIAGTAYREVSSQVIPGSAKHVENRQNDFEQEILLPRMLSTEGPRLVTGDVDKDQLDDFILLGAAGDPDKLFLQQTDGTFRFRAVPTFARDLGFESTCGALFDFDQDGDLDFMVGSGGNNLQSDKVNFLVRLYKNDGDGNFTADEKSIPPAIGNFSTLEAADFDGDGLTDVFLGARAVPGNYGLPPQSYLLKNNNGVWVDIAPPAIGNIGMVTDAAWADVDADGDQDLVVAGDWMPVHVFINEHGQFEKDIVIPNSKGWWTRVEAADLDRDGDPDFVLGNWGLNTKFKASQAKPLSMYVNDFDNNGKSEFILNWYPPLDNQAAPFAPKPELTAQLPALRKSILKYEDYSAKTYETLFPADIRNTSFAYEATYLQNAVLWNEGGAFSLHPLPVEAQVSPVFGLLADDLDGDQVTDLWLGGNFYALKPQVGRHDASKGIFLKGTGKSFVFNPKARLFPPVKGEVRDVAVFNSNGKKRFFVARNNEKTLVFEKQY